MMKMLTIRQPWASLIVSGHKRVENRKWNTKFRGTLAIHAAAKIVDKHEKALRLTQHCFGHDRLFALPRGVIIGLVEVVDVVTAMNSPWFDGPFGLVLRHARAIDPIIIHGGKLGFLNVSPALEDRIRAAVSTRRSSIIKLTGEKS